jgi:hypothetical protein
MMHDQSRGSFRQDKDQCKEHPDEEVTYFCFDCSCPPICSECVIHGDHKDHDVMTIKKSYPHITARLEDLIL